MIKLYLFNVKYIYIGVIINVVFIPFTIFFCVNRISEYCDKSFGK